MVIRLRGNEKRQKKRVLAKAVAQGLGKAFVLHAYLPVTGFARVDFTADNQRRYRLNHNPPRRIFIAYLYRRGNFIRARGAKRANDHLAFVYRG